MGMFQLVALGSGQDEGELEWREGEFNPTAIQSFQVTHAEYTGNSPCEKAKARRFSWASAMQWASPSTRRESVVCLLCNTAPRCNSPRSPSLISKIHHVLVLGRMGKSNGEFYKFLIRLLWVIQEALQFIFHSIILWVADGNISHRIEKFNFGPRIRGLVVPLAGAEQISQNGQLKCLWHLE